MQSVEVVLDSKILGKVPLRMWQDEFMHSIYELIADSTYPDLHDCALIFDHLDEDVEYYKLIHPRLGLIDNLELRYV